MRCSCRVCGTYMVQVEHGLNSGCHCPDCGNHCEDCMGSVQTPMDPGELAKRYTALSAYDGDTAEVSATDEGENTNGDWRKML